MKRVIFQTVCGLSLAVMAGAGAAHWASVRESVALASQEQAASRPGPSPSLSPEEALVKEARDLLAEAKAMRESTGGGSAPRWQDLDARLDRLLSASEKVTAQNAELRNQLAETNRDLMELQLRVDSHSSSFRPLRVAEDELDMSSGPGVLPPRDGP